MNEPNLATRKLTPDELAIFVRAFRESRHWSQEQLAEIARLNVRTVQRAEQGQATSLDTLRALALAFGLEDIDALSKPFHMPTPEELNASKEKFDRDNVTLSALPLTTGRQLAKLAESCSMDVSEPAFELPSEAAAEFAGLVDYYREYRDCADLYSETDKLSVHTELQERIDALKAQGVSLRYAERRVQIAWGDGKPSPVTALYVVAFRLGKEPDHFATPRAMGIGF